MMNPQTAVNGQYWVSSANHRVDIHDVLPNLAHESNQEHRKEDSHGYLADHRLCLSSPEEEHQHQLEYYNRAHPQQERQGYLLVSLSVAVSQHQVAYLVHELHIVCANIRVTAKKAK